MADFIFVQGHIFDHVVGPASFSSHYAASPNPVGASVPGVPIQIS